MGSSSSPPDAPKAAPRCPRCGGAGEPPPYRPGANPFLWKRRPLHVVCVDCGLDFDRDDDPPTSGDPPW